METDRELLELAAKAAGLSNYRYCDKRKCMIDCDVRAGSYMTPWIPLTDDGDALRLATALRLDISHAYDDRNRVFAERKNVSCCGEDTTYDHYAATRRAIVRCAAEIGRTM